MGAFVLFLFAAILKAVTGNVQEDEYFRENRRLPKAIVEALQDSNFDQELLFDLKKENQIYVNRTMSVLTKYIVKREVDNYRSRRTDAISRRIYSSLIMKLIDIAKDLPTNMSAALRIDTAHRNYMKVENKEVHDEMADAQVFHACTRLYDIMFTTPKILVRLGRLDDLTPRVLVHKLTEMNVQPIHMAIALLIQYHLRNTINFAIKSNALEILQTKPQEIGSKVISMLKAIATRLLPVSELLDKHISHKSPVFKDMSPKDWLGIVNVK